MKSDAFGARGRLETASGPVTVYRLSTLQQRGLGVGDAPLLRDVDTVRDARLVAAEAPDSGFATAWSRIDRWAS